MIIELASHMDEPLHSILPDILPAIVRRIDRGSTFKAFRTACRAFKELADKMHPDGDIKFANAHKILLKKFNMVPKHKDSIMLSLQNPSEYHTIYSDITSCAFSSALRTIQVLDFDALVAKIKPLIDEHLRMKFPFCRKFNNMMMLVADMGLTITFDATNQPLDFDPWSIEAAILILSIIRRTEITIDPPSKLYDTLIRLPEAWMDFDEHISPLDMIKKSKKAYLDYDLMSMNTTITEEFYLAHQDENWTIHYLLSNPSFSFEFAKSLPNPQKRWFDVPMVPSGRSLASSETRFELFSRIDVSWEFLTEHLFEFNGWDVKIYAKPHCATDDTRWRKIIQILLSMHCDIEYINSIPLPTWKDYDPNFHAFKEAAYPKKPTKWIGL